MLFRVVRRRVDLQRRQPSYVAGLAHEVDVLLVVGAGEEALFCSLGRLRLRHGCCQALAGACLGAVGALGLPQRWRFEVYAAGAGRTRVGAARGDGFGPRWPVASVFACTDGFYQFLGGGGTRASLMIANASCLSVPD